MAACGGGSNPPSPTNVAAPSLPSAAVLNAMASGDASSLSNPQELAIHAQAALHTMRSVQSARTSSFWHGVSTTYQPGIDSHHILPNTVGVAQPYIVGDQGKVLASISVAHGSRSLAYGAPALSLLGGSMRDHVPAFKRALAWLVLGNADARLPASLSVAWVGIDSANGASALEAIGMANQTVVCDFIANPSCAKTANLLVIGSEVEASNTLQASVQALAQAGYPILYMHTDGSASRPSANQILAALGLKLGDYGGNYFKPDGVAPGRSAATQALMTDTLRALEPIVNAMANDRLSLPYDWSKCAKPNDCSAVPGLHEHLLGPLGQLREDVNAYNVAGSNLFESPSSDFLRLMVLWGDTVRKQIRYPLNKETNPSDFAKALIADHIVAYVRPKVVVQPDLGSFARRASANLAVDYTQELVSIQLPDAAGLTAVGRFVVPGKAATVELVDGGNASIAIQLNTQRAASTRLWEKSEGGQSLYNRPLFLSSPPLALAPKRPLTINSPYGGTMQVFYSGASPKQTITLRIRGVAKHPYLDLSAKSSADVVKFKTALNAGIFDWAEIKLQGLEVHAQVDKISSVLAQATPYDNDIAAYMRELQHLVIEDAYSLAGYLDTQQRTSLTPHVQGICATLSWDCSTAALHKRPDTQHINVDSYCSCPIPRGDGGCAGNPYDQTWELLPRGWGESHEIGHNNQPELLMVYGDRSDEVSNNLFPLHKYWRIRKELGEDRLDETVDYQGAFKMVQEARRTSQADPQSYTSAMYKQLWESSMYSANTPQRLAFYMQWVHYWAGRHNSEAHGWDLVTLLYLHQRQLAASTDNTWLSSKNKLGYSLYPSPPNAIASTNPLIGNDNMLIALSLITKRDQRAVFDLWGVRYSNQAKLQVQSYGFEIERAFFYANSSTNNHATVKRVDMTTQAPSWPFV